MRRLLWIAGAVAAVVVALARPAAAHPLESCTVNHLSRVYAFAWDRHRPRANVSA
ncbi:MAG TPA: hypothetical protein VGD01_02555 [Candidatus Elarobacter sp.]|jgi:hypothetical protein